MLLLIYLLINLSNIAQCIEIKQRRSIAEIERHVHRDVKKLIQQRKIRSKFAKTRPYSFASFLDKVNLSQVGSQLLDRKIRKLENKIRSYIRTDVLNENPYNIEKTMECILVEFDEDTQDKISFLDCMQDTTGDAEIFRKVNNRIHAKIGKKLNKMNVNFDLERYRQACPHDVEEKYPRQIDPICSICLDEISSEELLTVPICGHSFCVPCAKHYIEDTIKYQNFPIVCPEYLCQAFIQYQNMVQIDADSTTLHEWKNGEIKQFLRSQGLFHQCPTVDCQGYTVKTKQKNPSPHICDYCGHQYCLECNVDHAGYTCAGYKHVLEAAELEDFKKTIDLQKCPYCSAEASRFEKNGHCNKMRCYNCRRQWLWVPGAKTGKKWVSYYHHDRRGETFDSRQEKQRWEKRTGRRYGYY